jgi:hypothetical protein
MFFTYWDDLGSTPARVNRFTGEIQINNRYFDSMPEFRKKFVIEHEKGHFLTNTRNEKKADRYAFKKLAGTEHRSLKESVYAISKVLSFRNPEHMERLAEVLKMALEYDLKHNNNPLAEQALLDLEDLKKNSSQNLYSDMETTNYFEPTYGRSRYDEIYDNAGGKERRQQKREERKARKDTKKDTKQEKLDLKNQKRAAKNEVTLAKADAKRTRADAKLTKAQTGESGGSWWDKTLSTVGDIFGKKSADAGSVEDLSSGTPVIEDKPKFLGMPKPVGIGVVVLLIIGIIIAVIFAVKKAKGKGK